VTTHAQLIAGKRVAVVGNTQRALRGVLELAQTAENVSLIAPNTSIMQSSLGLALPYRYNVDVYEGAQVVAVEGSTAVEQLVITQAGKQIHVPVDAVFVDLGLRPNTQMVRRIAALDGDDFVRVNAQLATSVNGLFAAGDVTTIPSENVLIGMGDGARAARSAYDYVLAHPSLRARSLK
jgi:thioredoxin reductase